jgi:hypothetical protein
MRERYTCPVCLFDGMRYPPANHFVCSCCGTQFGYMDLVLSHAELRDHWVEGGAHFWSPSQMPDGWTATGQLRQIEDEGMAANA